MLLAAVPDVIIKNYTLIKNQNSSFFNMMKKKKWMSELLIYINTVNSYIREVLSILIIFGQSTIAC